MTLSEIPKYLRELEEQISLSSASCEFCGHSLFCECMGRSPKTEMGYLHTYGPTLYTLIKSMESMVWVYQAYVAQKMKEGCPLAREINKNLMDFTGSSYTKFHRDEALRVKQYNEQTP